jgi:hypothetical protein
LTWMPCLTTIAVPRPESPMLTCAVYPIKNSKSVYTTSCDESLAPRYIHSLWYGCFNLHFNCTNTTVYGKSISCWTFFV